MRSQPKRFGEEDRNVLRAHPQDLSHGLVPSNGTLKLICMELKLPYKELVDLANEAKMRHKFGTLPARLAGKDPTLEPLEMVWPKLTEQQHQDIIAMAQAWAKRARLAV